MILITYGARLTIHMDINLDRVLLSQTIPGIQGAEHAIGEYLITK